MKVPTFTALSGINFESEALHLENYIYARTTHKIFRRLCSTSVTDGKRVAGKTLQRSAIRQKQYFGGLKLSHSHHESVLTKGTNTVESWPGDRNIEK